MPYLLKAYTDFRGGLNLDTALDSLLDNELIECLNADLDERGALSKRKGTIPLNVTSYFAQVEKLIEWPRKDGTEVLLSVIGNDLCKINSDYTKTTLKTLDSPEIGYFFYADKFYFTGKESGTDKYWQYDGTTVSEVTANAAADNTNFAAIKRCRRFIWHPKSQRIFAARDTNDMAALYYSEAGDPTYFKGTSKLYPTTGDGPIIGFSLFGDNMVAIYKNSEWSWKGVNPASDAEWYKMPSENGTEANKTIKLTPNSLTMLGQGGIISISPGLLDYSIVLLTGDELIKNRTRDKVTSIIRSITNRAIACAVFDKANEKFLLAYTDTPGATRNDKILVLDWGLQSFTIYDGLPVNDFIQRSNGDLLIASNNYILKMGQGYRDFDVTTGEYKPIHFKIVTKQWNLDYPFHIKKIKNIFYSGKQFDIETSTMDLIIRVDGKYITFTNISTDTSFVWGEKWGKLWGQLDLSSLQGRISEKGQRVQITIENNVIDEPFILYGLGFEFKVKKPKGVKMQ